MNTVAGRIRSSCVRSPVDTDFEPWEVDLHGHRVIYRAIGSGPPVVLIHGMVNSSRHWRDVALRLADRHTVIAPDLIGHGDSATPRGDYSLGAHAAAIRDLLVSIGVGPATVVGHSLGGGVAMQYFWQFPERVERLALVSSGGLGPDVSPMLRGAALPGANGLIRLAAGPRVLGTLDRSAEWLDRRGSRRAPYVRAVVRAMRPLEHAGGRKAFVETLRSVIDVRGQRVSAVDRLYLLGPVPSLIVWGERDHTIPIAHGLAAHEAIPNSSFATLPRAAHFPHLEDPEGLAGALADFIAGTRPHRLSEDEWGDLIASRTVRRPHLRAA
jgi:pimeloyl-ACP methyl ester carboxylesterase